jgi:glycine/D-amino acid oxidase-like deaminating enzyme
VSPDVIVIGGGVIGTSITFQLAKRGARVTLLEGDCLGGAATGASAGIIQPHGGPTSLAGHFRNGILLAPITAELVADLLLDGKSRFPTAPFDPARFLPHAA